MNILVFIKQVPDKNARLVLNESGRGLVETDLDWEINESDRYALETALRLKEGRGAGEVAVCTLGPDRARKAINSALAMGCDRGIHLVSPDFQDGDPLATAHVLAAVVRQEKPMLVLSGTRSDDAGWGQTSLLVAGLLDLPSVFLTVGVELMGDGDQQKLKVVRELERSRQEVLEVELPALLGVQSGIHEVRYTSLKGIMAAKKKTVTSPSPNDLDLSIEKISRPGSRLEVLQLSPPQKKASCEFIDGSPEQASQQLVEKLQREAKVL